MSLTVFIRFIHIQMQVFLYGTVQFYASDTGCTKTGKLHKTVQSMHRLINKINISPEKRLF